MNDDAPFSAVPKPDVSAVPKPDVKNRPPGVADPSLGSDTASPDDGARERGGISDFVRRAVSAGFEAAKSSKDDFVRVATTEIRSWLDHLDLDQELVKALSKMTIEVKAEFRFRPREDGSFTPEAVSAETKVKPTPKGGPL